MLLALAALRLVTLAVLLLFLAPLAAHALWWWSRDDLAPDWATADWSSARLLPPAAAVPGAVVRVYAARVGRWRGIFAHHSWLVVKEAGAARYTRYDVVGWGRPVRTDAYPADGRWFGNPPQVVLALDGEAAARAVPKLREAVAAYPYQDFGSYRAWPGPNSNTFVAHLLRAVPEVRAALPPTALGKDFSEALVALTPSRTGLQLSWRGYAGLTLGWVEGVEVNLLGAVAGLDLRRPALKLPGWGRIGMEPAGATGTLIAPTARP
ncbi:DUF3750 domain-containing protein [Methylobacterium sp. WSM2598]|uniref:DUF3750 domain-containing protein n=1 Tax=Methylobacterium sp. WSM2598 TaxID=398261 RepID=UPI0003A9A912|nr:DUF3750 domain-containing protein [Methylobacterium sp. WSM2598]